MVLRISNTKVVTFFPHDMIEFWDNRQFRSGVPGIAGNIYQWEGLAWHWANWTNLEGRGMQNQCCGKSRGPRVGIFQWIPTLVILSSLLRISCQCLIWIVCTNIRVQFKLKLNDVEESFLKSLPDISFRTPGNRLGGINCQWQDDSKLWLSFVKFQSQVDIRTLMAWSGWELSGAVKTINYDEWNGIANLFLWQRWENLVERNF